MFFFSFFSWAKLMLLESVLQCVYLFKCMEPDGLRVIHWTLIQRVLVLIPCHICVQIFLVTD